MSDELHQMRRALMALRLEVPQAVADDVSRICEAAVARLTRERDEARAIIAEARDYVAYAYAGSHGHAGYKTGQLLDRMRAALSPSPGETR